jgi:competence protein ComEC
VAAGVAATLLTTPIVAWHFDQVSLVGIPATLIGTPLVAAAIPGAFASLAMDAVHHGAGAFVAGGTDLLIDLFLRSTEALARLSFAVVWVPRAWLLAGAGGAFVALLLSSTAVHMRGWVRAWVAFSGVVTAVLLLPAGRRIAAGGTLELLFLDVGQGDAILVRSPGGRWLLVDAGPPGGTGFRSSGDPRVLAAVRGRGVQRLEAMLLTHPHLDHIGGAAAVLSELPVSAVMDPGMPRGTDAFVDVLEAAQARGSGWRVARAGDRLMMDGLEIRVLNALDAERSGTQGGDVVNENSLVVLVTFGAFSALLTGDAPVEVEQAAALAAGPVDVLKVGHHGSRTSTSEELLGRARPGAAVISVGRGNRYGHPHEPVLDALAGSGVDVYRTDLNGTVSVRARRDGSYAVKAERGASGGRPATP